MVKTGIIEYDKVIDKKIKKLKQLDEILIFIVYDSEKKTHYMVSVLRENILLPALGYEKDNDFEEVFPLRSL